VAHEALASPLVLHKPPDRLSLKSPSNPRIVRSQLPELKAIISGGQTGADSAGIRVGRSIGLATGGFAPLGFRTLEGLSPWLGTDYGLVESWSASYKPRTLRNVFASDATVRIARDFESSGERCTWSAIVKYNKPYFDVRFGEYGCRPEFIVWLIRLGVEVLNVAGHSESTCPGIGIFAEDFLRNALCETNT
jgi:hypothetical protein